LLSGAARAAQKKQTPFVAVPRAEKSLKLDAKNQNTIERIKKLKEQE
jgi:hypothetical protein